jgi:CRISPR/Cas system-associated exonuclease Cas4 (RecB family)
VYPQHEQQERLYGLCALKMYPGITYAVVQCNYIDLPNRATKLVKFTRNQEQDLEQEFTDFAAPLLNETLYPASPGGHCARCHFRKSNAGPCAFG